MDRSRVAGRRVFKNYKTATDARAAVTKAICRRVERGKSLALGPWAAVEKALCVLGITSYSVFPSRRWPMYGPGGDITFLIGYGLDLLYWGVGLGSLSCPVVRVVLNTGHVPQTTSRTLGDTLLRRKSFVFFERPPKQK